MGTLSPSAQIIQDRLREIDTKYKVIEFSESTRTAQEAADRVGCQLGQIVKSMVFKGENSHKGILVLTSGANRVSEELVSHYVKETILRADPEFVRAITGFAIGGVPPIGHNYPMETFVDEDLLQYSTIWAAAGTPKAVFELSSTDLIKMTSGRIVRVRA